MTANSNNVFSYCAAELLLTHRLRWLAFATCSRRPQAFLTHPFVFSAHCVLWPNWRRRGRS